MGSHFPLFLLLFMISPIYSHVALTFPEARYPPLDFLDTSRTMGPCGVPKPRIPTYTNLLVGSTYNFTWRMQYPHQGGYRLLLLDSNHQTVEQLAPMNGLEYAGLDEQIAQFERIRFSQPCQECIVVLERQALEWGKSYKFMSCADVNVLQKSAAGETICNGRGIMENGRCQCDSGFTGNICQYQSHCEHDEDCENGGKCVTEPSSLIMKSCYCSYGYFGQNCRQTFNQPSDSCFGYEERNEKKYSKYGMFDPSCYNKERLNDRDLVYFRKIKNDIEIILDFETTSWISLGWRPEGLDTSCRLFPDLEGVSSRRVKRMSNNPDPSEPQDEEIPPPSSPIRREPPPKKVIQEGPRPAMPKNNGMLDSALSAPMHAMDCVDIILASVKDGRLRIGDMYSRDRSTPLDDSWYDGEMSLLAAAGVEIDGRTVVMFRRNIQEIEPTDHPLGPGRLFVIWAKGQTQGSYSHNAPSAVESSKDTGAKNFYPNDEAKYHGNKNRGIHPIDFTLPVKKLSNKAEVAFGVPQVHVKPATEPHPEPEPGPEIVMEDGSNPALKSIPEPHPEPQPEPQPEPEPSGKNSHISIVSIILSAFFLFLL